MMRNVFVLLTFLFGISCQAQKIKLIIDADTGNEMDDMYAIVRALDSDDFELLGLVSAHFNNPQMVTDSMWHNYSTKNINTVELSQRENEQLLLEVNRSQIPHPQGCEKMVGFAWGFNHGTPVQYSEGVDFIITEAKKASPGNKLDIACLGPVTNVAAAILAEPDIAKNIHLHILSMKYDPETGVWNKNEFNARNDLNALDIVLDCTDLELSIISGQVSGQLVFERKETQKRLSVYNNKISQNLLTRWDFVNAGERWIMWDLALIESIIHPELAKTEMVLTPPENLQRKVEVYTDIDEKKMEADFWESYQRLMEKLH
ncbi:nucleoside hydrolase [Maribellus maritimus]|uniref:nucleoside hydrolase n=1 Tax=Maribellus maritimus TaxID=2870838 RepID=UPI001EEC5BA1|nr:nucleoside hydrolase [Maribellus maritimus]MCG6187970.1 nucleoside hydrolase [Maribellus maritimus]